MSVGRKHSQLSQLCAVLRSGVTHQETGSEMSHVMRNSYKEVLENKLCLSLSSSKPVEGKAFIDKDGTWHL